MLCTKTDRVFPEPNVEVICQRPSIGRSCEIQAVQLEVLGVSNDALYCSTNLFSTSNFGPTAIIFSRYVDVDRVGQWFVLLETDWSLLMVVVNSQQDRVSLIISYRGKGLVSVYDRMYCTSRH